MQNGYSIRFARFFFDYRKQISTDFAQLFGSSESDTAKGVTMQSKWGWYNTLYSLCEGNILNIDKVTELPILTVFTFLSYRQDYNNKMKNNYGKV